jgi:hypothetical protein
MKIQFVLGGLIAILLCGTVARGQLSVSGSYLGKIGSNGDVLVTVTVNFVQFAYFDRSFNYIELAQGTLNTNGTATLSTTNGRNVTLAVTGKTVTGTFVGVPFTAILSPVTGPMADKARGYGGTIIDFDSRSATVAVKRILADGRVALIVYSGDRGDGGIGTISTNGVVTVPMASGKIWTYPFVPSGGEAKGQISSAGFRTLDFLFFETQRGNLANISTRGSVGGGLSLIAGFVISGRSKTVLIRAVGPTLATFGVPSPQSDPILSLYQGAQVIASNDNWNSTSDASEIPVVSRQVGGFALGGTGLDSALLVRLDPGAYTANVSGRGPAGEALIEVYEVQ